MAPIDIGTRKQLFIDDRFIAASRGIELRMNLPVQHPEPVLVADKPWEALGIGAYNTVFREKDGRWRMWYDAMMLTGLPSQGARRLGYAESEDGIHWRKPELGLIEFQGSRSNNLVVPLKEQQSMQGATVFRDERAPSAERYKLWSKYRPSDPELAAGAAEGLWAMHSADGIRWQYYPGQPNPPETMCDTQNMFFRDDRLGLYVGYTRVRETQLVEEAARGGFGRYRSVGRITSPDFRHWSPLEITFEADARDLAMPVPFQRDDPRPNIDFYTSCAMKYELAQDAYLMFPSAYYHWGEEDYPATMDAQLLTSRDGIDWRRAGGREPFLRPGLDGSGSSGMLFANPWLIPVGEELWLYYSGDGAEARPPGGPGGGAPGVADGRHIPGQHPPGRLRFGGRRLRRRRADHAGPHVRRRPSRAQLRRQRRRLAAGRAAGRGGNPGPGAYPRRRRCTGRQRTGQAGYLEGEQRHRRPRRAAAAPAHRHEGDEAVCLPVPGGLRGVAGAAPGNSRRS